MKKIVSLAFLSFYCFTSIFSSDLKKGTVITLADGIEVSIEEVEQGDLLLTLDPKNNSIRVSEVKEIKKASQSELRKITLASGNELFLSKSLPIFTSAGWASADDTLTTGRDTYSNEIIRKYDIDSFVITINDKFNIQIVPIVEIVDDNENSEVYTLILDDRNVAFIANGIFVGQE